MKITGITLAGHENVCVRSCTIYVVLILTIFTINIGTGAYFAYSRWYLKEMLLMLSLVPVLKQQLNELINGKYQRN